MPLSCPSLQLEVVWFDTDLLELQLLVASAGFAGQADFYARLNAFETFAKSLEGFLVSAADAREYEFGNATLPGYGGAEVRLSCKDRLGHLALEVSIYTNPESPNLASESATVHLYTTPAEVDRFVADLQRTPIESGAVVALKIAA